MEEQERLTMELVKSLMDKNYTLSWVDYNDNLDNCRDTIQKCLEERSCESLWEKVDGGIHVNPEKPDVPLNKNDAFQKVQKRRVQEKR